MSRIVLSTLVAAALVGACTDGTGPSLAPEGAEEVSLSFSTTDGSGISADLSGAIAAGAEIRIASGSDSLVIRRAQMVLEEIEFESEDHSCRRRMAAAGVDTSDRDRRRQYCDGFEVEFGPVVVDLPTGDHVNAGATLRVPPGLYDEIKFDIEPLDDHNGRSDDRYGRPGPRNSSILVEGTFNGEPFVYLSDLEAEVELDFHPALSIRPGGFNVTIRVDVSGWFTTDDGQVIDPTSANAGGPNQALVERNILASLAAFGDVDRDGRRDDSH